MNPATRERIREAAREAVKNAAPGTPSQLATVSLLAEHVARAAAQKDTAPDTAA